MQYGDLHRERGACDSAWRAISILLVFAVLTIGDIPMYGPGGKTGWDLPAILVVTVLALVCEYQYDH